MQHIGLPQAAVFPAADVEKMVVPGDENLISVANRWSEGGMPLYAEYRIQKADSGDTVWIARRTEFVRNAKGQPVRMVGTVVDITERKQNEERQKIVSAELSHRPKNTFAMVKAIAGQTLRGVADRDAVKAFEQRVLALSHAHDILLRQDWASADMRALVEGALSPHADGERLVLAGPQIEVDSKAALSLSLLLHELATNAVKYGALSRPSGRVHVTWSKQDSSLILKWQERGGPRVEEPQRKGFGTRLVDMASPEPVMS